MPDPTTTPITGRFVLPDGEVPRAGVLHVRRSGVDTAQGAAVLRALPMVQLDAEGQAPDGWGLIPNTDGLRGTFYQIAVEHRVGSRMVTEIMPAFQVGDAASYTWADLFNTPLPDVPQPFVTLLSAEIAALQAANAASLVAAQAASDDADAAALSEAAAAGSAASAAGNAAVAIVARAGAETARDAAFVSADVFADTAAGLAATTAGDQFQVFAGPDIIRYRHDAGPVAVEVARYPTVAAVDAGSLRPWVGIEDARVRIAGAAVVPPVQLGARFLQPEVVSFDGAVQQAFWVDTGQAWSPDGDQPRLIGADRIMFGLRELMVEEWTFDLRPLRGRWVDTGLPFDETGTYDRVIPVATTTIDGRALVVERWSFDLRPLAGYFADTGEAWPVVAAPAATYPPFVVDIVDATTINLYFKRGAGATYLQWRLRRITIPANNTDVWRTRGAFECTRSLAGVVTLGDRVFADGEVETAIWPSGFGSIDYAGGELHGNEEITGTAPFILIDGAQAAFTTGVHDCGRFELYQVSDMFVPGSTAETKFSPKGSAFLRLYKRWAFGPDGLTFRVRLVPQITFSASPAFIGMAPFSDPFPQFAIRPPYWTPEDITDTGSEIRTNAAEFQMYGASWAVYLACTQGWVPTSESWIRQAAAQSSKGYLDVLRTVSQAVGVERDVAFTLNLTKKEAA